MTILAFDIGGANLKAADGAGYAATRVFPLWQRPCELARALAEMLVAAPAAQHIVATMTGELADCFANKSEGVRAIVGGLMDAAAPRTIEIYLTDGSFVPPRAALEKPLMAAASNWHALAAFAGRFTAGGPGVLIDIGSTTADLIPIVDGRPATCGRTDPERLAAGELVYTGVERSPVCAIVRTLPWRNAACLVAQEVFATALDAYVLRGEIPEDIRNTSTADGRPATRAAAHDRLARMVCADRELFDFDDARAAADVVADAQLEMLCRAARAVGRRMPSLAQTIILSGQGEFLAYRVAQSVWLNARTVSLTDHFGPDVSRVATAHALAVLARERGGR